MADNRRYELGMAQRRVLFRLTIFHEEGDKGYDKNCYEFQKELKVVLGQDATINSAPFMVDSMIFKITVPFERVEEAYDIIKSLVERYFPS